MATTGVSKMFVFCQMNVFEITSFSISTPENVDLDKKTFRFYMD